MSPVLTEGILTTAPPGKSQDAHSCHFLFNIALEVLATAIREEKEIKEIQIGKEAVTVTVCRFHDIVHRKF